ncbi:MAG: electron transport complex subunit E [Firmicutes bacterium]|jgi:electron transport complex protein RnfE|nr:electron transport complex subunit E [Bacillota bacterium]
MRLWKDLFRGIWAENPTFRLLIGMCPVLAVTNSAINGIAMGLATSFVLISSSFIISLVRNFIPSKVRIPCFIVIIATFVTIADLVLAAFFPDIHAVLGLFVPLIVVNCLILGRAEAFASKNPVINSFLDAVGMGLGFTWALTLLSIVREIMGMGSVFGITILGKWFTPFIIMVLPPGAFLTLGILLGIMNTITAKKTTDPQC